MGFCRSIVCMLPISLVARGAIPGITGYGSIPENATQEFFHSLPCRFVVGRGIEKAVVYTFAALTKPLHVMTGCY